MKPTSMGLARGAVPAVAPGALTASGTPASGYCPSTGVQTASHPFYRDH
ncbi:hypothetical protein [Streptomyces griseorubiginosus]